MLRLVVAALILTAVFGLLERRYRGRVPIAPEATDDPAARRRFGLRRDTRTDLIYWLFTPLVTRTISLVGLFLAIILLAAVKGVELDRESGLGPLLAGSPIVAQARWLQVIEVVLLIDFSAYWIHRAFHRGRLWRFHAVHHSPRRLTWLSSVRLHPVNDLLARIVQVVALLALGFDPTVLAGVVPFTGFYGLLLHARVPWEFGPLRYVIASPAFHRWHHSAEREAMDTNFAGLLPIWDLLFGTFHMPRGRLPTHLGVADEAVPEGFWAQLVWPIRRRAAHPPATASDAAAAVAG
ncbi:MAG: sterol desaturase family protein [Myxococcales bacterium]|nr:sterol desaturase family protein [Myxococcales bacterium]